MTSNFYLIGIVHNGDSDWGGWLILLNAHNQWVFFMEGPSPHHGGVERSIAEWFIIQPPKFRWSGTPPKMEYEEPGWFGRLLEASDCGWFLPFARRIADGEWVNPVEINAEYMKYHGGQPMPSGDYVDLFRHPAAKRPSL